jgi:peroxiredoxin
LGEIEKLGAKVITISADSPKSLAAYRQKTGLGVILLSDSNREVITSYGLLHPRGGYEGEDVSRPATLIVDKEGIVRWIRASTNLMVRPDPQEILEILQKL